MSAPIPRALGPDPVVWQRDELLDLDAIGRRLASRLGAGGTIAIGSCRPTCVSYAVRKRVRVLYEIEVAGNWYHIAASSFRSGARSERAYDRALESAHGCGPLKPVLHDSELEAVFWTFPNDRRLRALRAATEPSPGPARLLDGRWAKSELVDYYPEASAVVRCLDDSGETVAFAKVHAGEEGARTHRAQRALVRAARGSSLRLAHPLAYSSDHRMLLVEPIRGRAIGRLTGRDLSKGLFAYGAALATLHSLPLDHVPAPSRPQLERLKRKARDIGVVRPDIEARGNELLAEISKRWPAAQDAPVFVHGDANANNAILQNGRVALIDFDRASSG
ncbi:MAG: aminoglycoside phosphotransferase family protein, partial [Actinomycetota bacterium]